MSQGKSKAALRFPANKSTRKPLHDDELIDSGGPTLRRVRRPPGKPADLASLVNMSHHQFIWLSLSLWMQAVSGLQPYAQKVLQALLVLMLLDGSRCALPISLHLMSSVEPLLKQRNASALALWVQ